MVFKQNAQAREGGKTERMHRVDEHRRLHRQYVHHASHGLWTNQWPFLEPKLEVPTIYKAYVKEYPNK